MRREWEFDALRGLMLVLMTLTHLPTRWSGALGQPLGYVSAAEGFVLLSGFVAGLVYTRRALRDGEQPMRQAFFKRAVTVWACQAALLAFLLTVVAAIGLALNQPAINNLVWYYHEQPVQVWLGGLLLLYTPPLLDILPMYVIFLLASPWLVQYGLRHGQNSLRSGWGLLLAGSLGLWLAAQFGLRGWLQTQVLGSAGIPMPLAQSGSFDLLAWQWLWVLGLWLGASRAAGTVLLPRRPPPALLVGAMTLALGALLWRHGVGQAPLPGHAAVSLLFDKWQLGPLRMLNLMALLLLLVHGAAELRRRQWRLPRLPALEAMGRASLPVFCAHLVIVLLALALLGEADPGRDGFIDLVLLAGTFGLLLLVARWRNTGGLRLPRLVFQTSSGAVAPR